MAFRQNLLSQSEVSLWWVGLGRGFAPVGRLAPQATPPGWEGLFGAWEILAAQKRLPTFSHPPTQERRWMVFGIIWKETPSNFLGHPLAHSRIWSFALGGKNLALRLVFSWSLLSSWDQIRRIPNGSSPSRPSPSPRAQQASVKEAARLAGRPRSARGDR